MACNYTSAAHPIRYDHISSFYGPGAVGGWYLTALACLISFSIHPRKCRSDSITADLIAVLTFPTIAAADLIIQVRTYHRGATTSAQNAASIEATLIITETFLAIDVILFLLSVGFKGVRRPCLLATVGLFCFSTECYVYFSPFMYPGVGQQLDRLFLIDFGDILISIMAVLLICVTCALGLVSLFFSMPPRQAHAQPPEQAVEATRRELEQEGEAIRRAKERDFKTSGHAKALMIINTFLLSLALVASMFPLSSNSLSCLQYWFWPQIGTTMSRLSHDLIPKSNSSVKELDQAVALLAGATVFGFGLYSTADAYYQAWLSKTHETTGQREIELRTLDRNETPSRRRRISR